MKEKTNPSSFFRLFCIGQLSSLAVTYMYNSRYIQVITFQKSSTNEFHVRQIDNL